jgi:hypothetical protein
MLRFQGSGLWCVGPLPGFFRLTVLSSRMPYHGLSMSLAGCQELPSNDEQRGGLKKLRNYTGFLGICLEKRLCISN